MAYVYSLVNSLQNTEMVGDQECVALVKKYAHLGATATWRQGKKVFGDMSRPRGAAIATFVHGKYPASGAGFHKHAAFYLGQDANFIYVMDQWKGKKTKVSQRKLPRRGGMRSDGSYPDASNNAEAFYVIE